MRPILGFGRGVFRAYSWKCGREDNTGTGVPLVVVVSVAPDYFPEPGFWAVVLRADRVVLSTGAQYVRQSLHNRARIRTSQGSQWLTVPVRRGQLGASIAETLTSQDHDWWRQHRKALRFNYGKTPFYEHYQPELDGLAWQPDVPVGQVNESVIQLMAAWLDVSATIEVSDSPAAGQPLIDGASFDLNVDLPNYRQAFAGHIPGLSALDLLFNYGPGAASIILDHSDLHIPAPETQP